MGKPPKKSAKGIWDAQINSLQEQHAQRTISLNGETIQKKVILEALHLMRRADEATAVEVCDHIAFDVAIKTPEGRELVRELGYRKGDAYSGELLKIVESSMVAKEGRYVFDPADILEKLTSVEREMIPLGKTNVQEYLERKAESSASIARDRRRQKENREALAQTPESRPLTVDPSVGKGVTPDLQKAYEELGIRPDRMQRRLDDAAQGKPAKPLFYDREHPEANPDPKKSDKKDDKGNKSGGENNGPSGGPTGP